MTDPPVEAQRPNMIGPYITVSLLTLTGLLSIGVVSIDEPPASMSSIEPNGKRKLFMFGWYNEQPGVWESLLGADRATLAVREIRSVYLKQLSDLTEPFELQMYVAGHPVTVNFVLYDPSFTMHDASEVTNEADSSRGGLSSRDEHHC